MQAHLSTQFSPDQHSCAWMASIKDEQGKCVTSLASITDVNAYQQNTIKFGIIARGQFAKASQVLCRRAIPSLGTGDP